MQRLYFKPDFWCRCRSIDAALGKTAGVPRSMRLNIFRILLLISLPMALAGCAKTSVIKHRSGPRIVSTDPSATQILLQIGAAKTIVGVSPWDKPLLPKSLRNLPVVGGYLHLDEELVVQLAPTALILQQAPQRVEPGILAMARQNGIRIVNIKINTFHQLFTAVRTLGGISGCQKRAATAVQVLKSELKILAGDRPKNTPRVVYIISTRPIRVVGADNFMDQEITLAGGNNVAQRCGNGFPTITRGTLVRLNPQILLISKPGQPTVAGPADPRLTQWLALPIAAARARHVHLITWPQAQMLTLHVGRLIGRLRKLIHPPARAGSMK